MDAERRGSCVLETFHKKIYALENKREIESVSFNVNLFPLQMTMSPPCFVFCNRTQLHVRKIDLFSKLNVLPAIRSFLFFEQRKIIDSSNVLSLVEATVQQCCLVRAEQKVKHSSVSLCSCVETKNWCCFWMKMLQMRFYQRTDFNLSLIFRPEDLLPCFASSYPVLCSSYIRNLILKVSSGYIAILFVPNSLYYLFLIHFISLAMNQELPLHQSMQC